MKKYKIRYGSSLYMIDLPANTTIGDLKRNPNVRAGLGCGDNVNALYMGATLPDNALAPEFIPDPVSMMSDPYYGAIVFETAANKKE